VLEKSAVKAKEQMMVIPKQEATMAYHLIMMQDLIKVRGILKNFIYPSS
jgi:hypothetical protein